MAKEEKETSEDETPPKKNPNWWLFQKGRKKTGGRVKGTPNKINAAVADALANTYEGLGGDEALKAFAEDNPDEFYRLWVKMLPKAVLADITSNGQTLENPITAKDAAKLIKALNKVSK